MFTINLYKLKNHINKSNLDTKYEIPLIMFNNIIDKYPSNTWTRIKSRFFQDLPHKNINILYYTILSYELNNNFIYLPPYIKNDLIDLIISLNPSPYKLKNYSTYLLQKDFVKQIKKAYTHYLIQPLTIFKLIIKNSNKEISKIINIIEEYINTHKTYIFQNNYSFINIYTTLKNLSEKFPSLNTNTLSIIPYFATIPNDNIKNQIQRDFKLIEQNDKSIPEKIPSFLTIIDTYSYELKKVTEVT